MGHSRRDEEGLLAVIGIVNFQEEEKTPTASLNWDSSVHMVTGYRQDS
jgi:hypothetical protein